ncbi:MAG TPA: MerR family transcriptional regulator [Candidatus Paceibacterota bacterium]|nr:MerR family transcriptional regulator [Candidatus Paceibacterota bacterium]
MSYNINALAKLANVSVRTLHHYDAIGLLVPERNGKNKYRVYGESELLRLQQILFFRELEFSLPEIAAMVDSPEFDVLTALREHRTMLLGKQKRTTALIKMVDKTMNRLTKHLHMKDEELYDAFSKEEMEELSREAKQRWGHTDQYKESEKKMRGMSKEQFAVIQREGEEIAREGALLVCEPIDSVSAQSLIAKHYKHLSNFYTPTPEMYKGLAEMYLVDTRFTEYFAKYDPRLPQFMHDAMVHFADQQIKNRA